MLDTELIKHFSHYYTAEFYHKMTVEVTVEAFTIAAFLSIYRTLPVIRKKRMK